MPFDERLNGFLIENKEEGIKDFGKHQYAMTLILRGRLEGVDILVDYISNDMNNTENDADTGIAAGALAFAST